MWMTIALVFLVVGSLIFHFWSPWWFTDPAANWGSIDVTIMITFWVTGAVFVAVNLFMAYCVWKFKHTGDPNQRAEYEPENSKLEFWLTLVTAIGVAAMLAPGLYVWGQFVAPPEEAWELEAISEQWRWTYRLPGKDGQLGTSDISLVSERNPHGVNPEDPRGQDDVIVTSNHVKIPIDKPVKVLLRAKDVLHNFTVAEFRVKMDAVPGLITYMWFTPKKVGTYDLLCEEHCGIAHFTMRGQVSVLEQNEFDEWLATQPTFKEYSAREANVAMGEALYPVCAACHGAEGEGNQTLNAPRLAGQESWYVERQLEHFKAGYRGGEGDTFGQQMAPMASVLADAQAIRDISAYIESMPPQPATPTVVGDVARGEELYLTCTACHGAAGEGKYATSSPRLAGQDDWYMVRQLDHFTSMVRGGDRRDLFGPQMALVAQMFRDEESIRDVVAYINTLPAPAASTAHVTPAVPAAVSQGAPEQPVATLVEPVETASAETEVAAAGAGD